MSGDAFDPAHYSSEEILRDGGSIHVRAIRPDDRERLLRHFKELSEQSRYYRFFGLKRALSESELARFTDLDFVDHVGLVATLWHDGEERFIGVARYVRGADRSRAEVAFAVVDDHHGRGIAPVLLEHLSHIARASGITEFEADVLGDNNRMLEVFGKSGFRVKRANSAGVIHVAFPTAQTEEFVAASQARERTAAAHSVEWILRPKSVAVIGASRDRAKVGGAILANLRERGFTGALYPVNRQSAEVMGLKSFDSLEAIGKSVDLAIIAVPAASVEKEIASCAHAGVRAVVVITSGFAETGESGREAESRIRQLVRHSGMRMVGPNCMGVINTDPLVQLDATFSPVAPPRGNIGMFSQSGALGIAIFDHLRRRNLGLSSFVSAGNRADVSNNDLLAYWAGDPDTALIALYLESVGNPRKFARLARATAMLKPIVAVKSGRSVAGTRAASSHSASLANRDLAVNALFEQAGVIRTETLEALFDVVAMLSTQPLPAGPRVGVVSNAGGPAVLFADACDAQGLSLPDLGDETLAALKLRTPANSVVANPLDMTAMAAPQDFEHAIALVGNDPNTDSLVVMYAPPILAQPLEAAAAIARGAAAVPAHKPVLSVFLSSGSVPGELGTGARGSIPAYSFPENPAIALGAAWRYSRWRSRPPGHAHSLDRFGAEIIRAVVDQAKAEADLPRWLSREEITTILRAAQITVAQPEETGAPGEGPGRDQRLGGIRMFGGVTTDPTFGPLVLCGYGGPNADLLSDVVFRLPPVTDVDAAQMIASLRADRILDGYRGAQPGDREALIALLMRVSAMIEVIPEMSELELDPVSVLPPGKGAIVLAARMRLESPRRVDD
ncbi:MAG TPA: GNAT family N-acetyltransferase [Candidatus Binataceae bacterium]|nr:GNAT family N-acetyltransferase [Candidatus Binataceae bacterium]